MSLHPFFNQEPWHGYGRPEHLSDQNFLNRIYPSDLVQPTFGPPLRSGYYNPWRHAVGQSGESSVNMDKDGFHVMLDIQHFTPNEITVKHVDNQIVVEGKHEEKSDEQGFVSRHFVRRYVLPKNVNADALTSNLSSDGVLTITAPKVLEEGNVRPIPIKYTGAPAIKHTGAVPAKHEEEKKGKK